MSKYLNYLNDNYFREINFILIKSKMNQKTIIAKKRKNENKKR